MLEIAQSCKNENKIKAIFAQERQQLMSPIDGRIFTWFQNRLINQGGLQNGGNTGF